MVKEKEIVFPDDGNSAWRPKRSKKIKDLIGKMLEKD